MTDISKEWVTIKIPKSIRDNARDDSRTYGEIMQAGLDTERVTSTDDDPLAMYEDFRDVVEQAIEESVDGFEEMNQTVELEATTVNDIADEVERRLGR